MESTMMHSEGAEIVYDVEGSGPLLIMVAGRGGSGDRYTRVSAQLMDEYRLVRYDRRCRGGSTGDHTRPMDPTQQARDALAIVEALDEDLAYVIGNSAGANIALRIAEYFPEATRGVVAHDPMTFSILPDREDWVDFNRRVDQVYRSEGVRPAMKLLATSMVGMKPPAGASTTRTSPRSQRNGTQL